MAEAEQPIIKVDVVSDVVCPWCYIGKRNLEAALDTLEGIEVELTWRPFQLDPTIPPEGKDRRQYLRDKFGGDDRARMMYERVEEAGKAAGINFNFEAIEISPNTLDAHRLIRWAGGVNPEVQGRVVNRLFELYFLEGANIGDIELLAGAAGEAGLDGAIVLDLLVSDRDADAVRQEIAAAQQMGVTAVPCFILDQRYAVMGGQPPQVLADAIRQVAAEHAGQSQTEAG